MTPEGELHYASVTKDAHLVQRLLETAPNPAALAAARDARGQHALHWLAPAPPAPELDELLGMMGLGDSDGGDGETRPSAQQVQIVRLLVGACSALAFEPSGWEGYTPLHWAASRGWFEVVEPLLQAAPEAALVPAASDGKLPLHLAAQKGDRRTAELLLAAAPAAALVADRNDFTPLDELMVAQAGHYARSRGDQPLVRMLVAVPGQNPSRLLRALTRTQYDMRQYMADVPAHYPLTPADWHLIPSPCPGLAAILPDVLARSAAEAELLVARLPEPERCRLRTAAVCLHRAQAEAGVELPQPLVWRIMAACLV